MNKLLGFLILTTFLVSCSKSDDDTTTAASDKYMNFKAGSSWNYKQTNNTTSATTNYTLTSSDRDSTINGRSYHIFNNSNGSKAYYNVTGSDYYQYDTIPASISSGFIERLYLKDNLAAGVNWTQSFNLLIQGVSLPVTATNTVVEKGVSRTVNSIAYSDVIHIKTTLAITSPIPGLVFNSDIHAYYAKKTGLIENTNKITIQFGTFLQSTDNTTILVNATLL